MGRDGGIDKERAETGTREAGALGEQASEIEGWNAARALRALLAPVDWLASGVSAMMTELLRVTGKWERATEEWEPAATRATENLARRVGLLPAERDAEAAQAEHPLQAEAKASREPASGEPESWRARIRREPEGRGRLHAWLAASILYGLLG